MLRARGHRLETGPGPGQEVHAASYPRQGRLVLDTALRRQPAERARIFVHELFHFVWPRLANAERWSWEQVLREELRGGVRGELGWSAEWRKDALRDEDVRNRTRRWREYACESFCDTAAWLWSGVKEHEEFTLGAAAEKARRGWFAGLRRHHPAGLRI
jgi:hypothetical protein